MSLCLITCTYEYSKVSESVARTLLIQHEWNLEKILERFVLPLAETGFLRFIDKLNNLRLPTRKAQSNEDLPIWPKF